MSPRLLPRPRLLSRKLVALGAAAVLVLTASACEVKSGAAAFVGSEKISESQVSSYIGDRPADASVQSTANPRTLVLSSLIRTRLWTDYLQSKNAVPSDSELASYRDPALVQAFQSSAAPTDAQVQEALSNVGLDASFAPVFIKESELLYAVVQDITKGQAGSNADVAKLISDATPTVRLSPRYGTWSETTLDLTASTPGYLQLSGGTGTAAPAAGS